METEMEPYWPASRGLWPPRLPVEIKSNMLDHILASVFDEPANVTEGLLRIFNKYSANANEPLRARVDPHVFNRPDYVDFTLQLCLFFPNSKPELKDVVRAHLLDVGELVNSARSIFQDHKNEHDPMMIGKCDLCLDLWREENNWQILEKLVQDTWWVLS